MPIVHTLTCTMRYVFWRTKSGLEVDFILGDGEIAIEVKGASRVDKTDMRPLRAFMEEFKPRLGIVVSNEKYERRIGNITLLPWQNFLNKLWAGELL